LRFGYGYNFLANAAVWAVTTLLPALTASGGEENNCWWNQFRGPNGQGVAEAGGIPAHFGPRTNVLWKTPTGNGLSSPVIWESRIFLTTYDPRNKGELVTLCIDRANGRILWRRLVRTERKVRFHPMNGPATTTPVVDEQHVYVYFGTFGLLCYDHDGNTVWQRELQTPKNQYGMAASPILHRDKVILVLDDNGGNSRLLAVNRLTGDTVWERARPLFRAGWSTPMIWRHDPGGFRRKRWESP